MWITQHDDHTHATYIGKTDPFLTAALSSLGSPVLDSLSLRMKYIETELKKKKGVVEDEEQKVKVKNPEDLLYELPENIRVNSAKKTEEMLSNQMLSGIPEVDLGIE